MERKAHILSTKPEVENIEAHVDFPELADGWEDTIRQLFYEKSSTEDCTKRYIRERLQGAAQGDEMKEETSQQKFVFGQLTNDLYDKFVESVNPEDFVNATSKSVCMFMAQDFLFCKNNLYASEVDEEMYRGFNKFTSESMLTVMMDRVLRYTFGELNKMKKWRTNLDQYLSSNRLSNEVNKNPETHTSVTSSSKLLSEEGTKLKDQRLRLDVQIRMLEEEVSMLSRYKTDFKSTFEAITGCFDKPNIDISAKIRLFSKHDTERLDKLLFNMHEEKDIVVGLAQNKVENYLIGDILQSHKESTIRVFDNCLKLVPNAVHCKYLAQTPSRIFSRYDPHSSIVRKENPEIDQVFCLADLPHAQDEQKTHPYITNFYETLITESGQADVFLKFVFKSSRKLTNLLISRETLTILMHSMRTDDQGIVRTFREVLGMDRSVPYFTEVTNFPRWIIDITLDSVQNFNPETFQAVVKFSTDSMMSEDEFRINGARSLLYNQQTLNFWYHLLSGKEKLELFNQNIDEVFPTLIQRQLEYLEFQDFYNEKKILDINSISDGLKMRERDSKAPGSLLSYLRLDERIKIKNAFWIKEGILFKITQKQSNEHLTSILLKEQLRHPQIDSWLNLALNNDHSAQNYDLGKFVDDILDMLNIKLEDLKVEKKLAKQTVASCIKLLMVRCRNASLRLISYMNCARSIQKSMNLRFLDMCEQGKEPTHPFQSEVLKSYRKEDFFKLNTMFNKTEYEELRRIFDDESSEIKAKNRFGFPNFDPKFNRLISESNFKPYLYTNPSKGGILGGVIPGMNFETEEENLDGEEEIINTDQPAEKLAPENPFAEDRIEFKDISSELHEQGCLSDCPFVSITDSNDKKIVYDASIHDFFDLISDLALTTSFFLENEVAYYQDDQFEELDLQFEDDTKEKVLTQKNIHTKITDFDELFNYEFLFTRVLEYECQYQAQKMSISNQLFELSNHISDPEVGIKLFDYLSEVMSRRPHIDLSKYKYSNQNTAEWLQRVCLTKSQPTDSTAELTNLVTTLFDNYTVEIENLKQISKITTDIISHQKDVAERVDSIFKIFETFQGISRPQEAFCDLKPTIPADLIVPVLQKIDSAGTTVYNSFLSPNFLDRNTFASFMFDFHYKEQIEEHLGLPHRNRMDFLGVLNDFMNGQGARYRFYVEQSLKRLTLGETQNLTLALFEGVGLGDDLSMFEGEMTNSPENCFSILNTTYSFFKTQTRSSQVQTFESLQGANVVPKDVFLQQLNNYYLYLMNFTQSFRLKEVLQETGYSSLIYKSQIYNIHPIYESWTKNSRFEKPEDLLNTQGNLLAHFFDFGDACQLRLEDLQAVLREDLKKGANSVDHMSRLKSLHDLVISYGLMLSLTTQLNTFMDKQAECETSYHFNKICTNKESVFETLYRIDMDKRSQNQAYTVQDLRNDFSRGETSFRYYLYNLDKPYFELISSHMLHHKRDSHVDILTFKKAALQKLVPIHKDRPQNDTQSEEDTDDIAKFFREQSQSGQESEESQGSKSTNKRMVKRLVKISIPSKETTLDSVVLTIPVHDFIRNLLFYFRRSINYLALWLQNSKMTQVMFERTLFMSYNPTDVVTFQRDSDLGLSKLQQTVMRLLKFKVSKQTEEDFDYFQETTPLFDEYGSIKMIFKIPPLRLFREVTKRDLKYLIDKELTKVELSFFHELELFVFKRSNIKPPPLYLYERKAEFEYSAQAEVEETSRILREKKHDPKETNKQVMSIKSYLDSYIREILVHLRKLKSVEINEINRIGNTSSFEKQTARKILSGLHRINFNFKRRPFELNQYIGFSNLKQPQPSGTKYGIDRVSRASSYDDFRIEEIQETDLFIYYSQTNKLLSVVSLKLMQAALDLEANETLLLLKNAMPFYSLNNLRLSELENLLFHETSEQQAMSKSSTVGENTQQLEPSGSEVALPVPDILPPESTEPGERSAVATQKPRIKFEFRRLRQYLYVVKRIELKNRSNSRAVFTFVDEVKAKMTEILEDAKLSKPDSVFNTYLNCLFENEQRIFTLSLLDTIGQLRWLENFNDLVDINLDKVRKDKDLFYLSRSVLVNLLFPDITSFQVFYDLFTNKYADITTTNSAIPSCYPHTDPSTTLSKQLNVSRLRNIVKGNNLLNLFENSYFPRFSNNTRCSGNSFHQSTSLGFDSTWNSIFTQLLSFRSPQRTFISKKSFQIRLATESNMSLPGETIMPHNIWLFKILDAHRLLDLNVKNMLLMEILNSKIVNDLFCDIDKERSSVRVEGAGLNDMKVTAERRQIVPSLLPFVSNGMFQNAENYEFSRMVLRLFATELHLTSYMSGEDLSIMRFPDINFSGRDERSNMNISVESKLKRSIIVESVWPANPFAAEASFESPRRLHREEGMYTSRSESRQTYTPYRKEIYNSHHLDILKGIVENLRQSFFLADVPQAFNMCYLLMRELVYQSTREEISQLKLLRLSYLKKTEKCQSKDSTTIKLHRSLIGSLVSNSYLLETSACGEQVAIRKSDLHKLVLKWQEQFTDNIRSELSRREYTYTTKMEDIEGDIRDNTHNHELIEFYFSNIMEVFKKVVGSRLVMRNSSFITELDTLARYAQFINTDAGLMFDKIEAKLEQDLKQELDVKKTENTRLMAAHSDSVRQLKDNLIRSVEVEKEEALRKLK